MLPSLRPSGSECEEGRSKRFGFEFCSSVGKQGGVAQGLVDERLGFGGKAVTKLWSGEKKRKGLF
jgi:hypothetical protein